uniref:Ubiquitin-like protease family profile domain-containing protein n=1 Tax=Knipowitschia caucasica TaxID=637954 RepID=A0AAV2LR03_KNICA
MESERFRSLPTCSRLKIWQPCSSTPELVKAEPFVTLQRLADLRMRDRYSMYNLALLQGPHWLNDQVIGFAFEYFSAERFRDLKERVVLVSPEVTQFIKCASCAEELALFLEPLDLPSRTWLFLPVNDNSNQTAGGTHWSLLVYHRASNLFSHYDSQRGSNSPHARRIAHQLEAFVGCGGESVFAEEQCPSQQNSYDCGMYVVCVCEALCEAARGEHSPRRARLTHLTPAHITEKRAEWCRIVHSLAFH